MKKFVFKRNKKVVFKVVFLLVFISLSSLFIYKNFNKKDIYIDKILRSESYAYLPKAAQNYIKEVYEETENIVLTEKNKEENKAYLNPDYVLYLETGKASEYGYVPEPFIVDHSYKNDSIVEKHGNSESENMQNQSYYNLRENGYITNIYDQGNEGLCWAFASSTSLESHIAIKSEKEKMLTFSEKQIDYATSSSVSAIDAGTNPFYHERSSVLGVNLNEGGNMLRFNNAAAVGISPVLCQGNCSDNVKYNSDNSITDNMYWKHDYNVNTPLSPYEVFNIENTQYSVNEALFFNPLVSDDEDEVNALVQVLKNQIVNNGSLYVSVGAYTNLSIEYTPTGDERALNSNSKNLIYYIPTGWNPASGLNHAVSIIGWDDNYSHNICLNKTDFVITDAKKNSNGYYCSTTKETLHTINGAWILQNSWGVDKDTYIYLPYNSMKSSFSSISEVGDVDFDNSYRAYGWRNQFVKGDSKEKLNIIKIFVSSYNQTINVYYDEDDYKEIIVNDGSKSTYATLLKTIKTTYPGLYTIDLSDENIVYDNTVEKIWFRFDTDDSDYNYYASLHTNNVEDTDKYIDITGVSKTDESILEKCNLKDNKCISEPEEVIFDNDNNAFIIKGITRNLLSSDNLTFIVLDQNGEDVTDLFHIFRNFSVSNNINALISYNNNEVSLGTYTIKVYYNGEQYDELEWKLEKHNNIIDGIGTEKNPHRINNVEDLNDIRNHTTTNNNATNTIYGYYVLENDLDLTHDTQDKKGLYYNSGSGWDPIYKFAGNFDGQNHAIIGLYIKRTTTENDVGLFGTAFGRDNYIKNVIFKDVNITGNSSVGALVGGIHETRNIDIHDIAVVNGKILSNRHVTGGIIGEMNNGLEGANYNFYNLFNNATVGKTTSNFVGGIVGLVQADGIYDATLNSRVYPKYNMTLSDVVNYGSVYGDAKTGGVAGEFASSIELTLKNIISVGYYKSYEEETLGDVFGALYNNQSLNMSNIYYLNNLYGPSLELGGTNNINNNTKIVFKALLTTNVINNFEHKNDWIYPEIDGIKRIPMLKSVVSYFDFTEKIEDFDLGITETINIYDLINPKTDAAKNIEYTYDDEYLTVDSKGIITPKKLGITTIHINSLYDGYANDIEVNIKKTATITYNSNNKSNETTTQQVVVGQSVNLSKNPFEYKGNLFKNWNTKADGSGDIYTDEQLIEQGINEELQLYAQWTPIEYTIYFDGNGGISGTEDIIVWKLKYSEKGITIGNRNFKKGNYLIDNWNTKADGTGIKFSSDAETNIVFDEIPFDEDYEITLYAQWKKIEYKLYFDSNGGIGTMPTQTFIYDETQELNENTFIRNGYAFKNWNTKADGTGISYTNEQEISISEDFTLYAQWNLVIPEINKYKLKDNMITNLKEGLNANEFDLQLDEIYTLKIYDKSENEKTEGSIATGDKAKIYLDNLLVSEYTLVVSGDVTGDGIVNIADVLKIADHTINKNILTDYEELASEVTNDTNLNIADVLKIADYTLDKRIEIWR